MTRLTPFVLSMLVGLFVLNSSATAHIVVDAPNGGEQLQAGSITTIQWTVLVQHDTQNWDVWYSTTGDGGPWIEIATDLPVGDGSTGSVHTLEWTVPESLSDQVRVRVRQDNGTMDWEDISDADLSIAPGISLEQSELTRGERAFFRVFGAESYETVHFLYSLTGAGMGPQIDLLGGLQLDLVEPISVIGRARANQAGEALLQVTIPPNIPGFDAVWTQAVIRRGMDGEASIKSYWIEAPIN